MNNRRRCLPLVLVLLLALASFCEVMAQGPGAKSAPEDLHTRLRHSANLTLGWLAQVQCEDGHWSRDGANAATPSRANDADSAQKLEVASTGLAILAYTGYGHIHRDNSHAPWGPVIGRAAKWLISQQDPTTGRYGLEDSATAMLEHAIATMALTELLVMSRDRELLEKTCDRGTLFLIESISDTGGWREQDSPHDDSLATTFATLAIKTSKACSQQRLSHIPKATFDPILIAIRDGLQRTVANEKSSHRDLSGAVLASLFIGLFRGDVAPAVRARVLGTPAEDPSTRLAQGLSPLDAYFSTYATFILEGESFGPWARWITEPMLRTQIIEGANKGSWDPTGTVILESSRVCSTTLNLMAFEVVMRYFRLGGR